MSLEISILQRYTLNIIIKKLIKLNEVPNLSLHFVTIKFRDRHGLDGIKRYG
jgi:hypothetical protein